MTNYETVQAINDAVALHKFTITQAADWDMFLIMAGFLLVVFASAWGIIVALLVYGFNEIKDRISKQRAEDGMRCTDCKTTIWDHIDGPVWTAIKDCCPTWTQQSKEVLRDAIKAHTKIEEAHSG